MLVECALPDAEFLTWKYIRITVNESHQDFHEYSMEFKDYFLNPVRNDFAFLLSLAKVEIGVKTNKYKKSYHFFTNPIFSAIKWVLNIS